MRIRTVARDAALQVLAESRRGGEGPRAGLGTGAAKAEAERLGEALKQMAVKLMLIEGKDGWG